MAITNYTDAEQYAGAIVREAELAAKRQAEAAQKRQAALQAQAALYDQDYDRQVDLINQTKRVADANTGMSADNDLFLNAKKIQGASRSINNAARNSYGSIGYTKRNILEQGNDANVAAVANAAQTSYQQNADNRANNLNALSSNRNSFYSNLANQQQDINDDYMNGIGDIAANMFSDLSGISDYDVRSKYFWDSGDRRYDDDGALAEDSDRNAWIWNGELFDGAIDSNEYSGRITDYEAPNKVGNAIGQQNARQRQRNRSMDQFKSNTTSGWTFA